MLLKRTMFSSNFDGKKRVHAIRIVSPVHKKTLKQWKNDSIPYRESSMGCIMYRLAYKSSSKFFTSAKLELVIIV